MKLIAVLLMGLALNLVHCSPTPTTPEHARRAPIVDTTQISGAGDGDQRFAELKTCTLDSGEKIDGCRIGFRTWGKLNADKSNAVLFPTWFSGTTQKLVDSVPGTTGSSNGLVDTKKFFLVLVDAIGNGVSSSPSNSKTQARLKFPKFTIHDMVESQRRLLREVFGVQKLHAVMGISMGGMQSFEWVVSHPDEVNRFVPIVGTPQLATQDLLLWNAELHILQDSKAYANGEYEQGHAPKIPGLQELHWLQLTTPTHRNKETSRTDFPAWRESKAADTEFDWNNWHRQLEAMLAHDVARGTGGDLAATAKKVKAKGLIVVAEHDHMVNPEPSKAFAQAMGANGTFVSTDTPCGHMAPGCDDTLGPRIRKFIEE
jgi:homoserine O-acetyltransferase/O-succinyltransferase